MGKLRFITTEFRNEYPREFMSARTKKSIRVISCKIYSPAFQEDISISLHADFAYEINNRYDGYVMFCESTNYIREFEVIGQQQFFNIWFKVLGQDVIPNINQYKFLLEIELIY
jgi:hypothetical protein